jgi:hypothetical protein
MHSDYRLRESTSLGVKWRVRVKTRPMPNIICDYSKALPRKTVGFTMITKTVGQCAVSHIIVTSVRSKWAVGKARGGRISKSIRNRRATQPPAHFQRNPLGRGRLAVFPRCSLDPYPFGYGRFARALKNSQPTCGDITIICETAH